MSRLDLIHESQKYLTSRPLYLHLVSSEPELSGEVIEIAILDTDGSALLEEFVHPYGTIHPEISVLHGINSEMLHAAPPWSEVYPLVCKVLANRWVAVYDPEYCFGSMRYSTDLDHLRWEIDESNLIDIGELFSRFNDRWDARMNKFQTYPMLEAAQLVGLDTEVILYRQVVEDAALLRGMLLAMAHWKVN